MYLLRWTHSIKILESSIEYLILFNHMLASYLKSWKIWKSALFSSANGRDNFYVWFGSRLFVMCKFVQRQICLKKLGQDWSFNFSDATERPSRYHCNYVFTPPALPHTTLKCHIFCVKSGRVHNSESTKSYLLMAFHSGLHRYCSHPSYGKQDSKYHRRNVIGCKTWTIFLKWVYRGLIISLFIAVITKDIRAGFILRCCDTNQILGRLIHLYEEVRDELNIVGALSRSR